MLIHPATAKALDKFIAHPSHALIIAGPLGAGKSYLGRQISSKILTVEDLANYPYFTESDIDTQSIETVRKLKTFLSKKTTGSKEIRRIVLLNHADQLSDAAQNALLKSIEEPPVDTIIILTVDDTTRLLTTIQSRCTAITILPVTEQAAVSHYKNTYAETDIKRAHIMSKGYAGLLNAILSQPEHELQSAVVLAKEILGGSTFDKLAKIEDMVKGKSPVVNVLQAIEIAIRMNFAKSVTTGNTSAQKRLHSILKQIKISQDQLAAKTNPKLVLTRLFIDM